jgi:hypothetical protein
LGMVTAGCKILYCKNYPLVHNHPATVYGYHYRPTTPIIVPHRLKPLFFRF